MEKPAIPGRFSALNWPRRLLSREVMAEGKVLKSNGLLGERGQRGRNSRLGGGRLLVHRPRHVGQDARPIHNRPLPCPAPGDGVVGRLEIVRGRPERTAMLTPLGRWASGRSSFLTKRALAG